MLASEVMDIVKYVKECYVLCLDHVVIVDICVVAAPSRWALTPVHEDVAPADVKAPLRYTSSAIASVH